MRKNLHRHQALEGGFACQENPGHGSLPQEPAHLQLWGQFGPHPSRPLIGTGGALAHEFDATGYNRSPHRRETPGGRPVRLSRTTKSDVPRKMVSRRTGWLGIEDTGLMQRQATGEFPAGNEGESHRETGFRTLHHWWWTTERRAGLAESFAALRLRLRPEPSRPFTRRDAAGETPPARHW